MTIYRHFLPSNTSLSDDYDEEDPIQSGFFNVYQPVLVEPVPAQWSSKRRPGLRKPPMYSPISTLPPEILIHILKHLHSSRDLLSSLRVSRTWCECAVELLWHKPAFPKYATLEKMAKFLNKPNQTFTYARFIRRLNFLSLGSDLRDDIFSLFIRCDRLERLTLVGCEHISGDALSKVLPAFVNVVAIDLTGVGQASTEAIVGFASAAKRLQGINLSGCSFVSDDGVLALAANCPLLRRVKLSGLNQLTDTSIIALAENCPLLLEIDLNECELITDISIRSIWTHSVHMREMRLSNCPTLTDAGFPALPRPDMPMDAPNPFPLSNKKQDDLPPLFLSSSFEHLRMLDLTACAQLTDDAIEGIISHAPKIRNLVLSKCSLLTDRAVEVICKLGRHLHYLHLGHASKINDRAVRTLARSCTRIRYVDFANCALLTDMSVFELSALPKLRRIGLVRVNNLTDEAIYALAERHATLERIHLSYCDQISVMAVHFLLQKLHKLTHLSLTGVPAFRQPELQRFCRDAPRDFNSAQRLAFCVFSGKGVSQLRAYLTELFDRITELNGTDDTDYDEDEYDLDGYHEDDIPEPEIGGEIEDDDYTRQRVFTNPYVTTSRGSRRTQPQPEPEPMHLVQSHEFVFQRERPVRTVTVPNPTLAVEGRSIPEISPSTNLRGATSILNAQIQAATPSLSRPRGYPRGNRSLADMLPIVESSQSPPPSEVASERSVATDNSNGAGFFRNYQQGGSRGVLAGSNRVLTPDLNFAEIGHGRGAQGSSASASRAVTQDRTPRQPFVEFNHQERSTQGPSQAASIELPSFPTVGALSPRDESSPGNAWQLRTGSTSASFAGRELAEPVQSSLSRDARGRPEQRETTPQVGENRGRSVKRSLRNTLYAAEHYATSFLFGRSPADVREDENGAGPQSR